MIFCWNYCVDVVLILDLWFVVMIFLMIMLKFLFKKFWMIVVMMAGRVSRKLGITHCYLYICLTYICHCEKMKTVHY